MLRNILTFSNFKFSNLKKNLIRERQSNISSEDIRFSVSGIVLKLVKYDHHLGVFLEAKSDVCKSISLI